MDYNNFINQKVFNNKASKSGTIIKVERGYVFIRYDDEIEDDNLHQFNFDSFNVGTLTLDNADLRSQLEQERLEKERIEKEQEAQRLLDEQEIQRLSEEQKNIQVIIDALERNSYDTSHLRLDKCYTYQEIEEMYPTVRRRYSGRGINVLEDKIIIFSNLSTDNRYYDHWENGYYIYSAQGDEGFKIKANREMRDSNENGKTILLYIVMSPTEYYYQGEFRLVDYKDKTRDINGRTIHDLKFRLESIRP